MFRCRSQACQRVWCSKGYSTSAISINENGKGMYRGADKTLARPARKQARKYVRDARDFNKSEKRAVIKFLFLQGKAPKETHAILTEILACFLPGRAKDLSAPLYVRFIRNSLFMDVTKTYGKNK